MGTSSFSDLNNFGNEMVSFTDDRGYAVTITGDLNETNTITPAEGDTITFLWNQTVTEYTSPTVLSNLTIVIDLSAALAPQFDWGTLPAGVTTSVVSPDIHQVTGILTIADFNQILTNASAELVDQEADFVYTVSAKYTPVGGSLTTYTTTNTCDMGTAYPEISVPATAWTGDAVEGLTQAITNEATVIDDETGGTPTYTMLVSIDSSRITTITSTGGGSASSATVGSNIVRTITGTKAEVNAHLDTLILTLSATFGTLTINYQCTNILSGVVSTGTSLGAVIELVAFENIPTSIAYLRNTKNSDIFTTFEVGSDINAHYGDSNYKVRVFLGSGYLQAQLSGNASLVAGETITQSNTGATGVQIETTTTATQIKLQGVTGTWSTSSSDTITGSVSGAHSVYVGTIESQPAGDETNTENTDNIGWLQDESVRNGGLDGRAYHMIEKTASPTDLNTWLQTNINYIPIPDSTITSSISVRLYRTNGTLIKEQINIPMTGSGSTTVTGQTLTYGTGSLDPTNLAITDNERFFLRTDVLMLGAGGDGADGVALTGGTGTDPASGGGGGGGAGEYTYITRAKLFNGFSGAYWKSTVGDAGTYEITLDGPATLVQDELITQLNSGATGRVSFDMTNATNLVLYNVTGTFTTNTADILYHDFPIVENAGALTVGVEYVIKTLNAHSPPTPDTDFTLIGAGSNVIGTTFTATGVGAGGGQAYNYCPSPIGVLHVVCADAEDAGLGDSVYQETGDDNYEAYGDIAQATTSSTSVYIENQTPADGPSSQRGGSKTLTQFQVPSSVGQWIETNDGTGEVNHGGIASVTSNGAVISSIDATDVVNSYSSINFRPTSGGADTLTIQANNGGHGADGSNTITGTNGASGGCGGGGGGANPNVGTAVYGVGGGLSNGTNNVTVYTGGTTTEYTFNGNNALGPSAVGEQVRGGHGGGKGSDGSGYGILNDITGSSIRYCYPGRGGNNTGPATGTGSAPPTSASFRLPGSGGHGGSDPVYNLPTTGLDGLIVVKTYNF